MFAILSIAFLATNFGVAVVLPFTTFSKANRENDLVEPFLEKYPAPTQRHFLCFNCSHSGLLSVIQYSSAGLGKFNRLIKQAVTDYNTLIPPFVVSLQADQNALENGLYIRAEVVSVSLCPEYTQ